METNEDGWHLRIITVRYINILALNATKRMCNCFLYSSDTSFMFLYVIYTVCLSSFHQLLNRGISRILRSGLSLEAGVCL